MGRARRRKHDRTEPAPAVPARPARGRPAAALWAPATAAWLGPALVVVAAGLLFANSFTIPFLFDDLFEITGNPTVTAIDPPLSYVSRSRGIPTLSIALNHRWGGYDVWGYHAVNVAMHALNGLLVYALVLGTLRLPVFAGRYRADARVLATLVALAFIAHPLQTMAASYIVQRAESIASLFYLLTLVLFLAASTAASRLRRGLLYLATALTALLGVASKEIAVTAPVTVIAYQLCFLGGARRSALRRAFLAGLLLVPLTYAAALAWPYLVPDTGSADTAPRAWLFIPSAGFQLEGVSAWHYLLTQFGVILWYLRLYLLPTRQCFDYGWPLADSLWRADVLGPLLVLAVIVAAALASWRRYRLATFCVVWFFVALAPSSSIVPLRDAAFEHRMYLAVASVSWLVVVGGRDLLAWAARRRGADARGVRRAGAMVAAAWIGLLGAATVARNRVLQDPLRLAEDTVAKAPGNWRAQFGLAQAVLKAGRRDEAIRAYEEAIRLNPDSGAPRVELGSLYVQRRRYDDAEGVLKPATAVREESVAAAACQQLATVYEARGDVEQAVTLLDRAARLKPQWWAVHRQLALLYSREGYWFGAGGQYDEAIRLNPGLRASLGNAAAQAHYRAAVDLYDQGRPNAALRLLEKALAYRPDLHAARHQLAVVYANKGQWGKAVATLEALTRAQPDDALASDNLARARTRAPLQPPASPDATIR